jgi:excisionase family DNA binding protein
MPAVLDPADLLTPEQAAQLLGLSDRTLATWRSKGRHGLAWIRVGGRIRVSVRAVVVY